MDAHTPITAADSLEIKRQRALKQLGRRYVNHPQSTFQWQSGPTVLVEWLVSMGAEAVKRAGASA